MDRNTFNSTDSNQSNSSGIPINESEVRYVLPVYRDLIHNMRSVMTGYNNIINNYNQNVSEYLSAINEYRNDIRLMNSHLFNNLPHSQSNILHTPINSTRSTRTRPLNTRAPNIRSVPTRTTAVGNTESYTFSPPNASYFSNIFSFPSTPTVPINLGTYNYENVIVSPTQREIENAIEVFNYTENNVQYNRSCPITMEDFVINDRVSRIRYCGHTFKEEAINNWFRMNVRCPVCRYDIRDYRNNDTIDASNSSINTDDITNRITNELTSLLSQALQSQIQSNMISNSINVVAPAPFTKGMITSPLL